MIATNAIIRVPRAALVKPVLRTRHLYISPGHNFVGHHGGPPGTHPTIEVDQIECLAGRGIRGDRYLDYKENKQITFFAWEVFERVRCELRLSQVTPADTRRNVITEGIDLNTLIGREFEVQGVRFAGVEECRPCYWMNYALKDSCAELALKGHGGLRARILTDGTLRREC